MIKIQGLNKSFNDKEVLKNVDLTIKDGSVFGLVGINGSGKSTLLRLISGVYQADSGEVIIDGENVFENERIKRKIFFLPDEPYYNENVTPYTLKDIYLSFHSF